MPRLARIPPKPQLLPVNMVTPGHLGLNLQQESSVLPPDWATEALNAVIDSSGRLGARNALNTVTATPIAGAPPIKTLFEQRTALAGSTTIVAWDGGISTSVTSPVANDISGAVVDANGSWQFVNFNDKVIGFQSGQKLIVRTTGSFATVVESSGTAPTGGVGTAAYGRVWQLDTDGHTIKYSGLLNETQWTSGGAGQFDMQNVWPHGTDEVLAIEAFNHNMVVFGRRQIVFLNSATTSALGLDVTTLGVVDVIEGTGCVSQHTIQHVGDTDLVWLSPTGIQSMQRLLVNRSRPVAAISKYVRDSLVGMLSAETEDAIRSAYSPTFGFYLLSFPVSGYTWVVDLRRTWQDPDGDLVSPITRWNVAPKAMFETTLRALYTAGIAGGTVAQYASGTDNGSTFRFKFQTSWLDLGQDYSTRLKILKRIGALVFVRNASTVLFTYYVDFNTSGKSGEVGVVSGTSAEYSIAEYSIAEYSGGSLLQLLHIPAYNTGQYFRFSVEADVTGNFAIQQTEIFAKLGRIA